MHADLKGRKENRNVSLITFRPINVTLSCCNSYQKQGAPTRTQIQFLVFIIMLATASHTVDLNS